MYKAVYKANTTLSELAQTYVYAINIVHTKSNKQINFTLIPIELNYNFVLAHMVENYGTIRIQTLIIINNFLFFK